MKITLFLFVYVKTYSYLCNVIKNKLIMTTTQKKKAIKKLVLDMLKESNKKMIQQVDRALNCGAISVDDWSAESSPMIVPKTILTAILVDESKQYEGKGTSFEKQIKKEVDNLRHFL